MSDLGTGILTVQVIDGKKRLVVKDIYLQDFNMTTGDFLADIQRIEDVDYRFVDDEIVIILTRDQFEAIIEHYEGGYEEEDSDGPFYEELTTLELW